MLSCCFDFFKKFFCLFFHSTGFGFGIFMVIAQEVQSPMDEKLVKTVLHADAGALRFPVHGVC